MFCARNIFEKIVSSAEVARDIGIIVLGILILLGGRIMENIRNVAGYIATRYKKNFGTEIDEMKLHKMMYFAQRESYVMYDKPLFKGVFYGWKFGPILKEVRKLYKDGDFSFTGSVDEHFKVLMDEVFKRYASKDSWSLSRLTHGEISWKNSRIGVGENEASDNQISESDIILDAKRIRERSSFLSSLTD